MLWTGVLKWTCMTSERNGEKCTEGSIFHQKHEVPEMGDWVAAQRTVTKRLRASLKAPHPAHTWASLPKAEALDLGGGEKKWIPSIKQGCSFSLLDHRGDRGRTLPRSSISRIAIRLSQLCSWIGYWQNQGQGTCRWQGTPVGEDFCAMQVQGKGMDTLGMSTQWAGLEHRWDKLGQV